MTSGARGGFPTAREGEWRPWIDHEKSGAHRRPDGLPPYWVRLLLATAFAVLVIAFGVALGIVVAVGWLA